MIIPFITSILVGIFVIYSVILLTCFRLFKFTQTSIKDAVYIVGLSTLLAIAASIPVLYFSSVGLLALMRVVFVAGLFIIMQRILSKKENITKRKIALLLVSHLILSSIIMGVLVGIIRATVFTPFYSSSVSMEPNIKKGEYVLIKKFNIQPDREDIVIFSLPQGSPMPGEIFVKRIVGLPGEKVTIKDGQLYINDKLLAESTYLPENTMTHGEQELVLEDGQYYLLGDNRTASLDSRRFGPIHQDDILGELWFRSGFVLE